MPTSAAEIAGSKTQRNSEINTAMSVGPKKCRRLSVETSMTRTGKKKRFTQRPEIRDAVTAVREHIEEPMRGAGQAGEPGCRAARCLQRRRAQRRDGSNQCSEQQRMAESPMAELARIGDAETECQYVRIRQHDRDDART